MLNVARKSYKLTIYVLCSGKKTVLNVKCLREAFLRGAKGGWSIDEGPGTDSMKGYPYVPLVYLDEKEPQILLSEKP